MLLIKIQIYNSNKIIGILIHLHQQLFIFFNNFGFLYASGADLIVQNLCYVYTVNSKNQMAVICLGNFMQIMGSLVNVRVM